MKKKLYIIGAGSVGGHVALNIEEYSNEFEIMGFFDDDPEKIQTKQFGYNVIGTVDDALKLQEASVIIGIAFPKIKQKIIEKLSLNSSFVYPTLIHRKAWLSKGVTVRQGCIVYPGATINYGTEINDFVVINMNCSIGHHTQIGNYSSLAPGVNTGGHTIIERAVDVGIGVSTLQQVRIRENSTIGGQCMVIHDVNPETILAGVPGKYILE